MITQMIHIGQLEKICYNKASNYDHKIDKEKTMKKLEVYFDKMCDERIKKLNKELNVEVTIDKQKELEK